MAAKCMIPTARFFFSPGAPVAGTSVGTTSGAGGLGNEADGKEEEDGEDEKSPSAKNSADAPEPPRDRLPVEELPQ